MERGDVGRRRSDHHREAGGTSYAEGEDDLTCYGFEQGGRDAGNGLEAVQWCGNAPFRLARGVPGQALKRERGGS